MPRQLDTATLDAAARDMAGKFLQPSVFSQTNPDVAVNGREWVMQTFERMFYADVFEYVLPKFKAQLGPDALADFEKEFSERGIKPTPAAEHKRLLEENLAIDPDGNHIPGKIGKVVVGARVVGQRAKTMKNGQTVMKEARWPIYAGEEEERAAGSDVPDPLPEGDVFVGDAHLQPVDRGK